MKETTICIIAVIITCIILISCACAMPAVAEEYGEFYPRLSVVISSIYAENNMWIVTCQDKDGNRWAFFNDTDDWDTGDICNLLMWNVDEDITLHEIVEVYWEGYTEDITLWMEINGWR